MSRIHYNSEVWPSLFQMGLIIMLVVFNHIQPDQFFFLCGLMLIKGIYVFFSLQQTYVSRCHADVRCVPILLELWDMAGFVSLVNVSVLQNCNR